MAHPPAFSEVAEDLSEPLLCYLERFTGDSALAEDLLQETLIRIDRGLPRFEGRSSLKTWAFSIARHVATDHFRRPSSRAVTVDVDESTDLVDADRPVDQLIVIDEMNSCVRHVIDGLPEDYRDAMVHHDLEGLTAAQTADACGCSVPTAKIRIHRARHRLKEALQEECDFYRDSDNVLRCDQRA